MPRCIDCRGYEVKLEYGLCRSCLKHAHEWAESMERTAQAILEAEEDIRLAEGNDDEHG